MNSAALLAELQRQWAYPSVTVLLNTTPGSVLSTADGARAAQLLDSAAARLRGHVDNAIAAGIVDQSRRLLDEQSGLAAGTALALCVSPAFADAVKPAGRCARSTPPAPSRPPEHASPSSPNSGGRSIQR
jgi:hypothetical protein